MVKKRIACLGLCLSLCFGMFAAAAPRSHAVAPAVPALAAAFMAACGITFTATNANASTVESAFSSFVSEFEQVKGESFWKLAGYDSLDSMLSGVKILTPGVISLPGQSIPTFSDFSDWLIKKLSLVPGQNKPMFSSSAFSPVSATTSEAVSAFSYSDTQIKIRTISGSNGDAVVTYAPIQVPSSGKYLIAYVFSVTSYKSGLSQFPYVSSFYLNGSDGSSFRVLRNNIGSSEPTRSASALATLSSGVSYTPVITFACPYQASDFDNIIEYSITLKLSESLEPVVGSLGAELPAAGVQLPTVSANGSYTISTPYDFATLDALLNQILEKIATNGLTVSGSVAGDVDKPIDVGWQDVLSNIYNKVVDIPDAITAGISGALEKLFAPDAVLLGEMSDTFQGKFGFLTTLKQVGNDLFGMTADTEPPVIWVHLEDAEGRYTYGDKQKILDLSWYQRYKADVDKLISGFLWIAFLWLLFKRAPDIISGSGMIAEYDRDMQNTPYAQGLMRPDDAAHWDNVFRSRPKRGGKR